MEKKIEEITKTASRNVDTEETITSRRARERAIQGLNELLDNEFALFTKTLNYHWNVVGPRFHSLHEFLEVQYKELLQTLDDVAERIRTVGGRPHSTMKEIEGSMTLNERPGVFPDANGMLADLQSDHHALCRQIREASKDEEWMSADPGSQDFLVDLLRAHEKMEWMLRSHLQEPPQFAQ